MAENLGDLLPDLSPEACAARLKARAAPFADFITFDEKCQTFDLVWPARDPYSIPMGEISSPKDLVKWLAHLSEKPWVTSKHIAGFVTLVDIHVGLYSLYNGAKEGC
jgi:hypothetical protein